MNSEPKPRQGPKQFSYVVDAKNAGDKYVIEYTVERPERTSISTCSRRGMGRGGVDRLFTLTAVCPEDRYAEMEPMFRKILYIRDPIHALSVNVGVVGSLQHT